MFFDIRIRITPLVSSNSSSYITSQQYILTSLNGSTMYVSMSVFFVILDISHPRNMALLLLRFTDSDYPFGIFKRFLPFLTLCLNLSRPVRNDMHWQCLTLSYSYLSCIIIVNAYVRQRVQRPHASQLTSLFMYNRRIKFVVWRRQIKDVFSAQSMKTYAEIKQNRNVL
jgi:hypothetical protein